jgi:hypothetical protein
VYDVQTNPRKLLTTKITKEVGNYQPSCDMFWKSRGAMHLCSQRYKRALGMGRNMLWKEAIASRFQAD